MPYPQPGWFYSGRAMLSYTPVSESRPGSRGAFRGSRGYFGGPGAYGYYHLKGLEKRERFIYPIPNFHGKLPRYGHFRFWIPIYI